MFQAAQTDEQAAGRAAEVLEAAADFYRRRLWEGETDVVHRFLRRLGAGEEILDRFGVGYAPIGWSSVIDQLRDCGFGLAEIKAAGLASRSHRRPDRHYDLFRSRIMFPIRDPELPAGEDLVGFAAMALHPGPSWPRWLVSPDSPRFQAEAALFGLEHAAGALVRGREAIVLKDCIAVLGRHQSGQEEAVAVIRSRITEQHRAKLRRIGSGQGHEA